MDRELVERARSGDSDAYDALVRASADRLYATAYRIVRDGDLADEAVQLTLVQIWRELPSLRDPDRFEAWTYRLIVRFCGVPSRRARRKGVREVRMDESTPARSDAFADADLRDELDRALRSYRLIIGRSWCCITTRACHWARSPRSWVCHMGPSGLASITPPGNSARRSTPAIV